MLHATLDAMCCVLYYMHTPFFVQTQRLHAVCRHTICFTHYQLCVMYDMLHTTHHYTIYQTPHTIHFTRYTIHHKHTPYTVYHTPCTMHHAPCIMFYALCTMRHVLCAVSRHHILLCTHTVPYLLYVGYTRYTSLP